MVVVDTFDLDHPPTAPVDPAPTAAEQAKAQAIVDRVAAEHEDKPRADLWPLSMKSKPECP